MAQSQGLTRENRNEDFAERVTLWHQFRALFLQSLSLQLKAVGTNICQLLTPIIFVLFGGLMQVIVNGLLAQNGVLIPGTGNSLFPPSNPGRLVACSFNETAGAPHNPKKCRAEIFNFFLEFPGWKAELHKVQKFKNVTMIVEGLQNLSDMSLVPCQKELFDFPLYYFGKSDHDIDFDVGNITGSSERVQRSGFIGGMVPDSWFYQFSLDFKISPKGKADTCPVSEGPYLQVPMFVHSENRSSLNDQLIEIVKDYNTLANKSSTPHDQYRRNYYVSPLSNSQYEAVLKYIQNIRNGSLDKVKPQGGMFVDGYSVTDDSVDLSYTMVADDLVLYSFRPSVHLNFSTKLDVEVHRRNGMINMMSNGLLKYLMGNSSGIGDDDVPIATYIMSLPSQPVPITVDITTLLGGLLYPFAASFLIPVFMSSLVKDKFEKHLIMMEQNGLSRWTYWLVTYIFHFMLYVPIAVEIAVVSFAFQIRLFTQTHWVLVFLMFFVWGHAAVVLGFFLSNFFSRPRTATFSGYLIVVASVIVAVLLETLQVIPMDENPFPVYMLIPMFAFCRLFQYLNLACLSMQCYGADALAITDGQLSLVATALLYLAGSTVLLMVLSVYLSFVLPSVYGVRKSPFFPIIAVYKAMCALLRKCGIDRCKKRDKEMNVTSDVSVDMDSCEQLDEDVLAEENALAREFPVDAPLVLHKLRKEYSSDLGKKPYVAVHSVSLAIQRNECFGLLGPNGAGKTTLISVLTGLYESTSGRARIAGYDLATDLDEIHHHMGVCPQFDIQYPSLTCEEHLLFYSRLKGVKRSREGVVVERALKHVNLFDARKKRSSNLSGGMRRRLSVAMAVIGNPDILILDEPTTGLDPASRRQVWEVIETVKEGRSVILTTHAMEEADHLCTRIGIMNFGRLCCLGTQTKLKTKFGTGYQLTFNCKPGCVSDVETYVQTQVPGAEHIETYANTCSFKLEKADLKVSTMFQLFDSVKTRIGILDWGLKMTTLEDVFLSIVKNTVDDRTTKSGLHLPSWLPCRYCVPKERSQTE